MSVIKITVDDQNLHITDSPKIAAQGVNENQVEFTFSADWDGFGKTALFYREADPETVYSSLVDGNGLAAVPYEITSGEGRICLGVSGVKDDVVKTTEILTYKIVRGLYVGESTPPSPGMYEQMLTMVGEMQEEQTEFIDSVNNNPLLTTIEDNGTATDSTWSSNKIRTEIDDMIDNQGTGSNTTWSSEKIANQVQDDINDATAWKQLRSTPFSPAGENYWVEIPQTAKEIIVSAHITYTPSTKVSVMFHVPVLPHFFTAGAIYAIVNYYGSSNDGYARLDCSVIDGVNKVRLFALSNGTNDVTAACSWDVFYR